MEVGKMDEKRMNFVNEILGRNQYHTPLVCEKCGGVMVFKGVGEYRCEDCNSLDYDDYGRVRCYLEQNRGATAAQVEEFTGVKQKTIRQMLKESRLEVTDDSRAFLVCENCGKKIRSGRFCPQCEVEVHRALEEHQRKMRNKDLQGHGLGRDEGAEGEKRFRRDHLIGG